MSVSLSLPSAVSPGSTVPVTARVTIPNVYLVQLNAFGKTITLTKKSDGVFVGNLEIPSNFSGLGVITLVIDYFESSTSKSTSVTHHVISTTTPSKATTSSVTSTQIPYFQQVTTNTTITTPQGAKYVLVIAAGGGGTGGGALGGTNAPSSSGSPTVISNGSQTITAGGGNGGGAGTMQPNVLGQGGAGGSGSVSGVSYYKVINGVSGQSGGPSNGGNGGYVNSSYRQAINQVLSSAGLNVTADLAFPSFGGNCNSSSYGFGAGGPGSAPMYGYNNGGGGGGGGGVVVALMKPGTFNINIGQAGKPEAPYNTTCWTQCQGTQGVAYLLPIYETTSQQTFTPFTVSRFSMVTVNSSSTISTPPGVKAVLVVAVGGGGAGGGSGSDPTAQGGFGGDTIVSNGYQTIVAGGGGGGYSGASNAPEVGLATSNIPGAGGFGAVFNVPYYNILMGNPGGSFHGGAPGGAIPTGYTSAIQQVLSNSRINTLGLSSQISLSIPSTPGSSSGPASGYGAGGTNNIGGNTYAGGAGGSGAVVVGLMNPGTFNIMVGQGGQASPQMSYANPTYANGSPGVAYLIYLY